MPSSKWLLFKLFTLFIAEINLLCSKVPAAVANKCNANVKVFFISQSCRSFAHVFAEKFKADYEKTFHRNMQAGRDDFSASGLQPASE
jgi:hypothetical protein